jgi:hypothetical protein
LTYRRSWIKLAPVRGLFALSLLLVGCGAAAEASDPASAPDPSTNGGDPSNAMSQDAGASEGGADASRAKMDASAKMDGSAEGGADAGQMLPPMPHQSFLVGYNQAWFGKSYATDLTASFDRTYEQKILDDVNKAGGHVVRVWLFEGLQGITLATSAPQSQSVSATLLTNLDTLLTDARARGLWVYVTGINANDAPKTTSPGAQRDYYWNLLNDKFGEGDAFDMNVLAPMLAVLNKHQDVVYGFDMVNEIEAARQNLYWADTTNDARAFIQRTAAFVHQQSPWLKVTSSAGWAGAQNVISGGFFSGLGLDFYDLHVYADSGTYDGAAAVCTLAQQDGVPVILGEFGQVTQSEDDTLQQNVTQSFLSNAKSSCFTAGLAWRFDANEPWYNFERADGTFRPAVSVVQTYGAMP